MKNRNILSAIELSSWRKEAGLSQEQLAQMLDISASYLGQVECGSKPSTEKLSRRVNALRVSMEQPARYVAEKQQAPPIDFSASTDQQLFSDPELLCDQVTALVSDWHRVNHHTRAILERTLIDLLSRYRAHLDQKEKTKCNTTAPT